MCRKPIRQSVTQKALPTDRQMTEKWSLCAHCLSAAAQKGGITGCGYRFNTNQLSDQDTRTAINAFDAIQHAFECNIVTCCTNIDATPLNGNMDYFRYCTDKAFFPLQNSLVKMLAKMCLVSIQRLQLSVGNGDPKVLSSKMPFVLLCLKVQM